MQNKNFRRFGILQTEVDIYWDFTRFELAISNFHTELAILHKVHAAQLSIQNDLESQLDFIRLYNTFLRVNINSLV